jgi:hypothetical protein
MRPALVGGLIALAIVAVSPARATTEPASTYFNRITLTDRTIQMTRRKVDVGTLVVFIVRNSSSRPRRIVVGSYKSSTLPPGKRIQFELSFPVPWTFQIRSAGKNLPTLTAKFICSF